MDEIKNPDAEHFDKIRLNEVVKKIDKIWSHVPSELTPEMDTAWTASKAREETKKVLKEYFS